MASTDEHSINARPLHRMPRLTYRNPLPANEQFESHTWKANSTASQDDIVAKETRDEINPISDISSAGKSQQSRRADQSKREKMPLQGKKTMRGFLDFLKVQEPSQVALREFAQSQKNGSDTASKRASSASSLGSSQRSWTGGHSRTPTRGSGTSGSSRTSVIRPRKHPVGLNSSNAGLHSHSNSLSYERPKAVYIEIPGGSNTVDETIDPVTLARHELLQSLGEDEVVAKGAGEPSLLDITTPVELSTDSYPVRTTSRNHGEHAMASLPIVDVTSVHSTLATDRIPEDRRASLRDNELSSTATTFDVFDLSLTAPGSSIARSSSPSSEARATVADLNTLRTSTFEHSADGDECAMDNGFTALPASSCISINDGSTAESAPISVASTIRLLSDSNGTQSTDPALFEFQFSLPNESLPLKEAMARPVTPDATNDAWEISDNHSTLPPLPASPAASTRSRMRTQPIPVPPALILSRPFTPASAHSRNISQSSYGSAPSINFSRPRLYSNSPTSTELPNFKDLSITSNPSLLHSPHALDAPPPTPLSPANLSAPAPSPCSPNPAAKHSLPTLHRSSSSSSLHSVRSHYSVHSTASNAPSELSIRWSQSPKERLGFGNFTPTSETAPWTNKNGTGPRIRKLGAAPWEEEGELGGSGGLEVTGRSGAVSVAGDRSEDFGWGARKSVGRRLSLFGKGNAIMLMGI